MLKKNGFTLAEVLITICILGIVAAITLPALNANINNSVLEKQTLKFITQTEKAFDLYKIDEDVENITAQDIDVTDFAKKYYNVNKVCNTSKDCFEDEYGTISSNSTVKVDSLQLGDKAFVLQDGMTFSINTTGILNDAPFPITFDINGKKGPNMIGQDLWTAYVHIDGSINDKELTPDAKRESTDDERSEIFSSNMAACKDGSPDKCLGNFINDGFKITTKKKK